jgi:nicotinamide-nucleotide amidase
MTNDKRAVASIITIGDELLIGQTIDTNSAWMGVALNEAGVIVKRRVAVGDNWDDIWDALEKESIAVNVVLITGGLGPTADDITKPLLCKYFDGKMIVDQGALDNVIDIFTNKLGRPLIERNLKQAEVPDTCTVIPNKRGTAPGMLFRKNDCIFISMPGVPHEMKGMMSDFVMPWIKKEFLSEQIIHKTLLTAGIGESFLAEMLVNFEEMLPESIKLAYLPSYGMVRLRLTTNLADKSAEIEGLFEQLKSIVKDYLVIDSDISMPAAVAGMLKEKKLTISIAESCTGGYISHLLTSMAGSSLFYEGGVVSYSNDLKTALLGVPNEILMTHGAVSTQTVEKMAEGIRLRTGTDIGLATSGIMGPSGGTETKPVGFVCVGVSTKHKTVTTTFQFRFDRARNIELTAIHALNFLRKNMV